MYSMKELAAKVGKSAQALYSLMKTSSELSAIVKENSEKQGRLVFYNDAVLQWLISYYGIEAEDKTTVPCEEEGERLEPAGRLDPDTAGELSRQKEEIERLRAEISSLQERLNSANEEKRELLQQNGNLLLLLNQEKAEKQALLPAPKKTFREWVSGVFGRKSNG